MSTARLGTFDDLLQMTEQPLRPVAEALRALVFDIHPEACEVVRLGDRAATYGVGPRKMIDGYAYILPYGAWADGDRRSAARKGSLARRCSPAWRSLAHRGRPRRAQRRHRALIPHR